MSNVIEFNLEEFEPTPLPAVIKILHKDFVLRKRNYQESFGNTRLAEINFLENEINYLPIEGSETVDSIIHEMLHGIFHMFNLNHGMPDEVEEHYVTVLATGIATIMMDNPDLFPALQDMLDE